MFSHRRIRFIVAVVLLCGAGVAAYLLLNSSDSIIDDPLPDPRLTYETQFRNVRPNIAYVGDAACAPCHSDIDGTYHQHPMGRSASLPLLAKESLRFSAYGHAEFLVDQRNGKVFHSEVIKGPGLPLVTEAEIIAVIGSGTRGKSYLSDREGSLWQSGASWFAEKSDWDTSPGFWPGRHALRGVVSECLFCHVNHVEPIPGSFNRYRHPFFTEQLSIGCERCHGPGELHVAERSAKNRADGRIDTSIVNPRHLPADLREDVCRQCHLQGQKRLVRRGRGTFDYRPGLPLDQFISVYVAHPNLTDYSKSVGQVEQVAISQCAAGSAGRFGCISCHDPHAVPEPAVRDAFYRDRCLTCHQEKGCSLPVPERQLKNDVCTTCHMPKTASSNIAHTAVTDHRVLRRPAPGVTPKKSLPAGELPLVSLGGTGGWPEDPERARDLAVALSSQPDLAPALLRDLAERLRLVTDRHRGDVASWEALATVRLILGDGSGALKAAEAAVTAQPHRELALAKAAESALQAGKPEKAQDYATRALVINPAYPDHRLRLALALIDRGRHSDAETELRKVLSTVANHARARAALAVSLYKQGRTREAVTELDRAAAIYPEDNLELRNWFSTRTR